MHSNIVHQRLLHVSRSPSQVIVEREKRLVEDFLCDAIYGLTMMYVYAYPYSCTPYDPVKAPNLHACFQTVDSLCIQVQSC